MGHLVRSVVLTLLEVVLKKGCHTWRESNIVCEQGAVACGNVLLNVLEDLVRRLSSAEHCQACAAMRGVI
jgi:hypothetical protein